MVAVDVTAFEAFAVCRAVPWPSASGYAPLRRISPIPQVYVAVFVELGRRVRGTLPLQDELIPVEAVARQSPVHRSAHLPVQRFVPERGCAARLRHRDASLGRFVKAGLVGRAGGPWRDLPWRALCRGRPMSCMEGISETLVRGLSRLVRRKRPVCSCVPLHQPVSPQAACTAMAVSYSRKGRAFACQAPFDAQRLERSSGFWLNLDFLVTEASPSGPPSGI